MPSIWSAFKQLERHVEFTAEYLLEHHKNLRLQAEHGLTDQWYLSEEAETAYRQYGELLRRAHSDLKGAFPRDIPKVRLIPFVRRRRKRLRQALDEAESTPEFLALVSHDHAAYEVVDVLLDILTNKTYVPRDYRKWNHYRTNRWYHTPYVHDPEALRGTVFWVDPQTRLVLFDDRVQLRWRHGRVLLDVQYSDIESLNRVIVKRKTHIQFKLKQGAECLVNADWVCDVDELFSRLNQQMRPGSAP